jgi:putative FmdB family regulatory protein
LQGVVIVPIYAYRCEACGFAKDALQKLSDAPLSICPSCNADAFKKQLTAAGFQLKGSGWYATDFKNGATAAKPAASTPDTASASAPAPSTEAAATVTDTKPAPAAT